MYLKGAIISPVSLQRVSKVSLREHGTNMAQLLPKWSSQSSNYEVLPYFLRGLSSKILLRKAKFWNHLSQEKCLFFLYCLRVTFLLKNIVLWVFIACHKYVPTVFCFIPGIKIYI